MSSQSLRLSVSPRGCFPAKHHIPSSRQKHHDFVNFSVDKNGVGVRGIHLLSHRHLNCYLLNSKRKLADDILGYSDDDDDDDIDEYSVGQYVIPKSPEPEPEKKNAFSIMVESISNWVWSLLHPESIKLSAAPSGEISGKGVSGKVDLGVEFKPGKLPKQPKSSYEISQTLQKKLYEDTTSLEQYQEVVRLLWASSEGMRREAEKGKTSYQLSGYDLLMGHTSAMRISTGSSMLDQVLGGGISTMQITEVYGVYGWGKKELAHTLCVTTYLSTRGKVIYADSSDSFDPDMIKQISERFEVNWEPILKNIVYVQLSPVNDQWSFLKRLTDGRVKLLVLNQEDKGEEELSKEMFGLRKIALELKVAVFVMSSKTKPASSMRHGYKAFHMPFADVVFDLKPGGVADPVIADPVIIDADIADPVIIDADIADSREVGG